jgi:hypothetical protein
METPLFLESNPLDCGAPWDLGQTGRHFNADETDKSNRINMDYSVFNPRGNSPCFERTTPLEALSWLDNS